MHERGRAGQGYVIPKCRLSFVFWGVPSRFARGRAASGFAGAPSRLWRDHPFGAPSASLTQGGGACGGAALETYTNSRQRVSECRRVELCVAAATPLRQACPPPPHIKKAFDSKWYYTNYDSAFGIILSSRKRRVLIISPIDPICFGAYRRRRCVKMITQYAGDRGR